MPRVSSSKHENRICGERIVQFATPPPLPPPPRALLLQPGHKSLYQHLNTHAAQRAAPLQTCSVS
jgi:hypothetical protein